MSLERFRREELEQQLRRKAKEDDKDNIYKTNQHQGKTSKDTKSNEAALSPEPKLDPHKSPKNKHSRSKHNKNSGYAVSRNSSKLGERSRKQGYPLLGRQSGKSRTPSKKDEKSLKLYGAKADLSNNHIGEANRGSVNSHGKQGGKLKEFSQSVMGTIFNSNLKVGKSKSSKKDKSQNDNVLYSRSDGFGGNKENSRVVLRQPHDGAYKEKFFYQKKSFKRRG